MVNSNQVQNSQQKMSGSMILWVVITIIFMIFSLGNGNNLANPILWIMLICLIISLVMVFNRNGSRWFVIISSIIFGSLFLYTACTVTGSSLCAANWKSCIVTDMKVWNQAADVARIGGFIIAGYMFYTSIFFLLSNSVKMHFSKSKPGSKTKTRTAASASAKTAVKSTATNKKDETEEEF